MSEERGFLKGKERRTRADPAQNAKCFAKMPIAEAEGRAVQGPKWGKWMGQQRAQKFSNNKNKTQL